jgi:O-antigen/teichoic acid export membrane protein
MFKYIYIYFWQAISILFNFASIFIITPLISSQPNLFGIYSIIIAAYLFISYADLGFLSAGMKYAAECFAQNKQKDEIEIIGFTGAVFLVFSSIYGCLILLVSFYPTLLVKGISDIVEIAIAKKLLLIMAFSCPLLVLQRIIQIIFGIRLKDYIFQRVLIISNCIKLISAFIFFHNGSYMIVEYFLFSQLCLLFAVISGFIYIKNELNYDILELYKSFRFTNKMYLKTRKLAFTSIFLTISWVLYYELDTFAIAKIFGVKSVAIYAIGLTIITYFRSLFGILFTPFIARFNHFVGIKDKEGLKNFFIKVVILFLPITVFPVLTIYFTVDNFILTWVGNKYITSIHIASILTLTYIFSFITYPSGILIMANERVKALYITSAIQPIIFWFGIILTKNYLGLEAFAYFKMLAIFIETIIYTIIILKFLNRNIINTIKQIFLPTILPIFIIIILLFIVKPYMPYSRGKIKLIYYFSYIVSINLIGLITYYFTSPVFKVYTNNFISSIFLRFKLNNIKY